MDQDTEWAMVDLAAMVDTEAMEEWAAWAAWVV